MNVLFLNSLKSSKWGGGEKWMIMAGKGLKSRGHHVIVACLKNSVIEKKTRKAGLEVLHFGISMDIAFWQIPRLKTLLREKKVDILICCQNKDVKIGARAARQQGIQGIYSRQGVQNLSNKKRYIKPFTKYIDGIITNTQSIKSEYESYGWFPSNFLHVIYNGVEIREGIETIDLQETYNLAKNSKVIFSAGRIDFQKGFDLLIEVARLCKEDGHNWQFLIAGEGKLKAELMVKSQQLDVDHLVHFIGFSDQISSLMKSCDVFVLPSRFEGMPNALLEAMAAGKASVATSVNGAPELVEDNVSGFLVESENTGQIYQRLRLLLTDDTLRRAMERKAMERVKNRFTVDKMIDNLESLFLKQLGI